MLESILNKEIEAVCEKLGPDSKAARLFTNCYPNTLATTTKPGQNGRYFVFTGDIPAMWLRDSSAQVRHYLPIASKYPEIAEVIEGLCRQQTFCILADPYANAYNNEPNWNCWSKDKTERSAFVYERKYEVDSLCYPIQLAYLFWKATGRTGHFTYDFHAALHNIVNLWIREQDHMNRSPYSFERSNCPASDTLPCEGKGNPVAYTGMTWSGFRPSDDACKYGYLVPSNMFAWVVLGYVQEIAEEIYHNSVLCEMAAKLQKDIKQGIENYAIVEHPEYGKVYAYEVDGLGNVNLMDDANVPSLLSIPYLGYCQADDPIYQNTRRMILSKVNPYYYEGTALKGIGSPHTPPEYVWHIALSMQGLTTTNKEEAEALLNLLVSTDGDTGFMHEGVYVNDPKKFTRDWFAWSNSLFSEFVLHYLSLE